MKEFASIRLTSKLLGKLTSSFQAIKFGQLYYCDLERLKSKAITFNNCNFDKKTPIDSHCKQKNNIVRSFNPIRIGNPSFTIITNEATLGTCFNNNSTGEQFAIAETLKHINVVEFKAIFFGLRSLYNHICDSHIKVLSGNTTAIHCINSMGACRSVYCDKVTESIWDWAIKRRLWLSRAYIPGKLNRKDDEEFRKTELSIEWKLNITNFHNNLEYFQHNPVIDLFASRLNAQLLRFFSYRPDPFPEVKKCFLGIMGR